MATDGVRWGILGTGRMAAMMAESCQDSDRFRFVAVAARDEPRACAFAAQFGMPYAYGSYRALLASDEVDAVYVATPNSTHAGLARLAHEHGLPTLVEKPYGCNLSAVRAAVEAAQEAGVITAEAFQWRFDVQTALLRELVAERQPEHIQMTFSFPIGGPLTEDIRGSDALDGGALNDVGCYCVAAARLLSGEPTWVQGTAVLTGLVDSRFFGVLGYREGQTAAFDCGMDLRRREWLELVGPDWNAVLPDPWHARDPRIIVRDGDHEDIRRPTMEGRSGTEADAYRKELDAVSAAILTGGQLEWGGPDAIRQAIVLNALHASARDGKPMGVARS